RFLPSKSYGVEAPILLGSGCVAWIAWLAALFRLCFFPRLTIWVTSLGFCAAELLPPHPRFYSMFSGVTNWSNSAQPSRIRSRVHNSGVTVILEEVAMPVVRSRRGHNADLPSGPFPIFRAIGVLEDVVFPHRFYPEQLTAGPAGCDEHGGCVPPDPVDAVDQKPVGFRPMARDRETGISAASHIRSVIDNANVERQKLIEASAIQ